MFRLKDKKLQSHLDKLSDGEFSKAIALGGMILHDDSGYPLLKVEFGPVVGHSHTCRFSLVFEEGDIEEAPEYNPKSWNRFPDVIPPVDVCLRLNVFRFYTNSKAGLLKEDHKYCAKYSGGFFYPIGSLRPIDTDGMEVTFRPWED